MAQQQKSRDPGLGSSFLRRTKRIINKDGSFNVVKEGALYGLNDAYLYFINLSWTAFLFALTLIFILINMAFALVYYLLGPDAISMPHEIHGELRRFAQAFFFSTQTFTTVGYGAIYPSSGLASFVASIEAMTGFLSFSLATGLLFGRFSKPNARIRFSKHMLLSPVKGVPSLLFRIGNERPGTLMEMKAKVILVLFEEVDGKMQRTFAQLPLESDGIEFFPLNWTIVHPIEEGTPLFGKSEEEIMKLDGELLIHIRGFDEHYSQIIHRRYSYKFDEMICGKKFVRPFETTEDGEIVFYLDRLDDVE